LNLCSLANENRYEGTWRDDKKNGPGKYYYLTHGQMYEGVWLDDVAKCGTMKDFDRDNASEPTQYPIPKVNTHYTYIVFIKSLNSIQEKARKKHVVCSFIIVITNFVSVFFSFSPYV